MATESSKSGDWSEIAAAVGGFAHEIKNPLSTIKLNLQLLSEDWQSPGTQAERRSLKKLEVIKREIERLNDTLDSFLRYARIARFEPVKCDVNNVVNELTQFVAPEAAANGVDIVRYMSSDLPPAMIDVRLLKQALLNLVLNAEHAMEQGGRLEVRTSFGDGLIRIEFIDTGKGIAPNVLPKIFDAFYSTKKSGTGLGLATTRRIIERHGGTIDVMSELGSGSRFVISIPPAEIGT